MRLFAYIRRNVYQNHIIANSSDSCPWNFYSIFIFIKTAQYSGSIRNHYSFNTCVFIKSEIDWLSQPLSILNIDNILLLYIRKAHPSASLRFTVSYARAGILVQSDFFICKSAFFSRRETCACDIPIS